MLPMLLGWFCFRYEYGITLECVYRGDLKKVEDMLNNTPELALGMRELTDLLVGNSLRLQGLNDPDGQVAQAYGAHWSFDEVPTTLDEYVSACPALLRDSPCGLKLY
jgi:hypothetical protein